ncbi:hypothetical protein FJZ17_02395 [Candidatus Pacearchaeota archaeon]|nr:hypothetical protein [Candidatus Pacearchaeota archaeon]
MNKKGFWGKFFMFLAIIILVVLIIVGITAYQEYSLVKAIEQESPLIEQELKAAMQGDCTKLESAGSRIANIYNKAQGACKNPLIKIFVEKMEQIPIKCNQLDSLKQQFESSVEPAATFCKNQNKTTN